ncbi:MAG: catalase-related domain-containing protein [Polyangiaceae bacterium]
MKGFTSFREPIEADKVRGKPERFAEHYAQATLFWNSQTPAEKMHSQAAFRFELSRVQVPAVRERMVASLANVDATLAEELASDLGIAVPEPLPRAAPNGRAPEVTSSPALSLLHRPRDGSIRTRRVAILIGDGVDDSAAVALHAGLQGYGAVPRYVGVRLGAAEGQSGTTIEVEATLETTPSVLYDAVALPGGEEAMKLLATIGHAAEFIKDQYRHCKPILALGAGGALVENAGVPRTLPSGDADPGLLLLDGGDPEAALTQFVKAIAKHRHFERDYDPPEV